LLWGIGTPVAGYSLPKLLDRIREVLSVQPPQNIYEACIRLNKFYIATRYPNALSEGIPEEYYIYSEAEEAIHYAEIVLSWVEEIWRELSRLGGG